MNWDVSRFNEYKADISFNIVLNSVLQVLAVKQFKLDLINLSRISFYYVSVDGLRPVIHGHDVHSKDFLNTDLIEVYSQNRCDLKSFISDLDYADFTLVLNPILSFDIIELKIALQSSLLLSFDFDEILLDKWKIIKRYGKKPSSYLSSVIIPVYRDLEFSWASIKSALKLDGNVEIIIVNDNPTIVDFKQKLDCRVNHLSPKVNLIYIEHKKRRGGSGARNTGLLASSGVFVSFLDDDDIYTPARILNMVNCLINTADEIGSAYCGFSGGSYSKKCTDRFKSGNLFLDIVSLNYFQHYINTDTQTFKRGAILKINGFNETYVRHQDIELNTRFFQCFNTIAFESFDVLVRPNKHHPTYVNTYENILLLKDKYFNDFKYVFKNLQKNDIKKIVDNHANDVAKYFPKDKNADNLIPNIVKRLNKILYS